jgi:hypothetical protein
MVCIITFLLAVRQGIWTPSEGQAPAVPMRQRFGRAEMHCFFGVAREAEKVILAMSMLTVSIIFLAPTLAHPGDSRAHVDLSGFTI